MQTAQRDQSCTASLRTFSLLAVLLSGKVNDDVVFSHLSPYSTELALQFMKVFGPVQPEPHVE